MIQRCHVPSTSPRVNAISFPSGEIAGAQMNGVCVARVRVAPVARLCASSVLRQRELMKAIEPAAAIDGELSGPGPVVRRTGLPRGSGANQILLAPPRVDEWTTPRPSGVNVGE